MTWTNVAKPSTQTYTNVNTMGKEQYDQADITYDSITTYYDGVNPNQWTDIAKPTGSLAIVDSYSESNQNAAQNMTQIFGAQRTNVGQAFTCSVDATLSSCKFYLKKGAGSPTGTATAQLFLVSGTVGTTAVPTGSALVTSATYDVSNLTSSYQLITFTFSTSYNLVTNIAYAIVLTYLTGTDTNAVGVGVDTSSPTHAGNNVVSVNSGSSWTASATTDTCFYVYGTNVWNKITKPI